MFGVSEHTLARLRRDYPAGARVELTKMSAPYRPDLVPGCRGTVQYVDDSGAIHVCWDCHSSLAVIFGQDACKRLDTVTTICYGDKKQWDTRKEAMSFFLQAIESSEGSEQQRYLRIYTQLSQGYDECSDTPPNNAKYSG